MRRSAFSRGLAAALFSITMASSGAAFAGDVALAEHLFAEGLAAMKRNDFKAACEAFAGSNEVDPSTGTQINLALCNEKQGNLATAWGWYRNAAGLASKHMDEPAERARNELATAEAAKLEPRLQKVVINVRFATDGLSVTRNGRPIPSAAYGDLPVDPGEHTFEATAKGKKPWSQKVTIVAKTPPGAPLMVDIPALEDAEPSGGGVIGSPPVIEGGSGSTQKTVGLILGGSGIVAGVVAGVFGALTLSEEKERETQQAKANAEPDKGRRDAFQVSADSHEDAGKNNQVAGIVFGASAAALLGVGIILLVTAPSSKSSASSNKTYVMPVFGNGNAGLGLGGSF